MIQSFSDICHVDPVGARHCPFTCLVSLTAKCINLKAEAWWIRMNARRWDLRVLFGSDRLRCRGPQWISSKETCRFSADRTMTAVLGDGVASEWFGQWIQVETWAVSHGRVARGRCWRDVKVRLIALQRAVKDYTEHLKIKLWHPCPLGMVSLMQKRRTLHVTMGMV